MATIRDPRVVMAPAYQGQKRTMRRPQHKFTLQHLPYQFQPFMIAPVLPGETLQHVLVQARSVSEPLKPTLKLIGWWWECWLFYVKHRDLQVGVRDDLTNMALDPAENLNALRSAAATKYYHFDNGVNFTLECAKVILEEYFRDEGEDWDEFMIDGMPAVRLHGRGHNDPFDKLTLDAQYASLGVAIPTGAEATMEDMDYAWQSWQAMREAGLMDMDYNDYIKSFGVAVREDEASPNLHRPELIRHMREWSYPTNIVEPTTGVPATAATFSVAGRGDKRMFFPEPGWVVGFCTARPKVYMRNQTGSVAHGMDNVQNWIPPVIHGRSDVAHKNFAYSQGPLPDLFDDTPGVGGGAQSGYWIDLRDLLAYGDQFANYALAAEGTVNLPTNTGQRRYVTLADIQAMFTGGAAGHFKTDGVCSLGVLGRQQPSTARQVVLGSGSLVP